MKVAKIIAYGGVENIVFAEVPSPKGGIRVMAAPVTAGDVRIRSGKVPRGFGTILRLAFGWRAPRNRVQGWSFAGTTHDGARVFGITGIRGGAHAEMCLAPHDKTFPIPTDMDFDSAAVFWFGGLTAAGSLLDVTHLRAGERILINGATGAVGSAAVQIAASLGAEVTAVCSRDALARSLGAAHVIDYRNSPISGQYDVILDIIGTLPWARAKAYLVPRGRLCLITADLIQTIGAALRSHRGGRRVYAPLSGETPVQMARLLELYHTGAYCPLVGQTFDFNDIHAAHALAETFSKPGNIVLRMA